MTPAVKAWQEVPPAARARVLRGLRRRNHNGPTCVECAAIRAAIAVLEEAEQPARDAALHVTEET
jgi:hypothetical protein